ncbi:MAG: esterase, partial [Synechococcus sp.]|nr:esterase [Synechococcus sp.]
MPPFDVDPNQPVVILGGFLITDEAYGPMAHWIQRRTGAPVRVVHATRLDWLATSWAFGWIRLLDRVDACVQELAAAAKGGSVTLIGHSSGGVMLRPYLSDDFFQGRRYGGA